VTDHPEHAEARLVSALDQHLAAQRDWLARWCARVERQLGDLSEAVLMLARHQEGAAGKGKGKKRRRKR
jgi:hypothetical protein